MGAGTGAVDEARRRALAFDPGRVGFLEARGWQAYYARHWPKMAVLLFRLVRSQLGLPPLAALRAVRHGAKAAVAFAPAANDPATARAELRCFYAVARNATGLPFYPDAAGDAEFDYWVVHRQLVGRDEREPLIRALAAVPATVYGVPVEALLPSAAEREKAVRLVDRITAGLQPSTDAAWREIAQALGRSYILLQQAVATNWAAETPNADAPGRPTEPDRSAAPAA